MNYTHEQIDEKFDLLPEKLQAFITSEDASEAMETLAEGYNIASADAREALFLDLLALMVGLGTVDEFIDDMKTKCDIPEEHVNGLVVDAHRVLLRPAFELAKEDPSASTSSNSNAQPQKNVDQYVIGEIELPPPAVQPEMKDEPESREEILHKIEVPRYTPPARPAPATPSNLPTGQNKVPAAPQRPASILDAKLSGTTSMPTEEVDVSQQKKPRYTGVDPYREPIE